MLPEHEWLPQAKLLNVGASKRVKHNREPTCAMQIRHLPDKYTAYCYRCHEGGVHHKQHVRLSDAKHERSADLMPGDALEIDPRTAIETYARQLNKAPPWYLGNNQSWISHEHNRVIFAIKGGYLGRSLNQYSKQKWCLYSLDGIKYPSLGLALGENYEDQHLVLTEDFLSARKVDYACGRLAKRYKGVALLGTGLGAAALHSLLEMRPLGVSVFFDGDKAGRSGADTVLRRLRGLGIESRIIDCPDDNDPKDLDLQVIAELLE